MNGFEREVPLKEKAINLISQPWFDFNVSSCFVIVVACVEYDKWSMQRKGIYSALMFNSRDEQTNCRFVMYFDDSVIVYVQIHLYHDTWFSGN